MPCMCHNQTAQTNKHMLFELLPFFLCFFLLIITPPSSTSSSDSLSSLASSPLDSRVNTSISTFISNNWRVFIFRKLLYQFVGLLANLLTFTVRLPDKNAHLIVSSQNTKLTLAYLKVLPFTCPLPKFHWEIRSTSRDIELCWSKYWPESNMADFQFASVQWFGLFSVWRHTCHAAARTGTAECSSQYLSHCQDHALQKDI